MFFLPDLQFLCGVAGENSLPPPTSHLLPSFLYLLPSFSCLLPSLSYLTLCSPFLLCPPRHCLPLRPFSISLLLLGGIDQDAIIGSLKPVASLDRFLLPSSLFPPSSPFSSPSPLPCLSAVLLAFCSDFSPPQPQLLDPDRGDVGRRRRAAAVCARRQRGRACSSYPRLRYHLHVPPRLNEEWGPQVFSMEEVSGEGEEREENGEEGEEGKNEEGDGEEEEEEEVTLLFAQELLNKEAPIVVSVATLCPPALLSSSSLPTPSFVFSVLLFSPLVFSPLVFSPLLFSSLISSVEIAHSIWRQGVEEVKGCLPRSCPDDRIVLGDWMFQVNSSSDPSSFWTPHFLLYLSLQDLHPFHPYFPLISSPLLSSPLPSPPLPSHPLLSSPFLTSPLPSDAGCQACAVVFRWQPEGRPKISLAPRNPNYVLGKFGDPSSFVGHVKRQVCNLCSFYSLLPPLPPPTSSSSSLSLSLSLLPPTSSTSSLLSLLYHPSSSLVLLPPLPPPSFLLSLPLYGFSGRSSRSSADHPQNSAARRASPHLPRACFHRETSANLPAGVLLRPPPPPPPEPPPVPPFPAQPPSFVLTP
eukprot:21561-Hanusia_phi.AAC.1